MCGIFGGIKNINIDKVKLLGVLNEERGTDSTGIFDIKGYIKSELAFREFLLEYGGKLDKYHSYVVGHTRFATTGSVCAKNSHPFVSGNIVGVHNGMISNFKELRQKYAQTQMECDSEIIFYLINKYGIGGLKELKGYFAIVYADRRKPDELCFLNHYADFAYCMVEKAFYFSSDIKHLRTVLCKDAQITELAKDTLLRININDLHYEQENVSNLSQEKKIDLAAYYRSSPFIGSPDSWDDILMDCPFCNEPLTIDEIEQNQCPFCQSELSICGDCGHNYSEDDQVCNCNEELNSRAVEIPSKKQKENYEKKNKGGYR